MPDLAAALDEALRARYPRNEVRTPITQRRGLDARMNQLEKLFTAKGDRKGAGNRRAAEAAGIPLRTWQKWRAGTATPSARNLRKLETAHNRLITIPRFKQKVANTPAPNRVTVSAVIVWNGYKNRQAHRTTTLEGMRHVMRAVFRAWATAGPEAAADAFQRGTADAYNTQSVQFEGNDVEVTFP